jgi:hypothetical protein
MIRFSSVTAILLKAAYSVTNLALALCSCSLRVNAATFKECMQCRGQFTCQRVFAAYLDKRQSGIMHSIRMKFYT